MADALALVFNHTHAFGNPGQGKDAATVNRRAAHCKAAFLLLAYFRSLARWAHSFIHLTPASPRKEVFNPALLGYNYFVEMNLRRH
jgi:hypothetical protein